MSTLTAYRFKSDRWASFVSHSSGAACWNRTDEAPVTVMAVPTPMFVVKIKSASLPTPGHVPPRRRTVAAPAEPPKARPAEPEPSPPPAVEEAPPSAALAETPAADAPAADEAAAPAAGDPAPASNRIELIIDSLPHHALIQSIPVTVEPFADKIFSATATSLAITATGASIGETLLLLKEQIESMYDELQQKAQLDDDQRRMLKELSRYIARDAKKVAKETKKSDWFRR